MDIGHVDRARIDIDRRHVQVTLIVMADIAHSLGQRDYHRSRATCWFHGGHEAMLGNNLFHIFRIANNRLRHKATERIGCEILPTRLAMKFEVVKQGAQHVARPSLERLHQFAQYLRKQIDDIRPIAPNDIQITNLTRFALMHIDTVGHSDRHGLHAVTEDGMEIMARLATAQ
ncbi:hypothetical protein YGS_C2P0138 [Sphingobium sp. YG1]|nr:hypothetical protein YGS_C2P0138 [Sphingobium sp. YG1]